MLIIGQPKSASTALIVTLAKILNVQFREGLPRHYGDANCKGFDVLQTCHSNMIERSFIYLEQEIYGKKVFKEHLLPIKDHIDRLKKINKPVIVLLRKPEDSYDCYVRMFDKNNNKKTDRTKLKKDIKKFYNDWRKVEGDIFLFVYYKDLILDYEKTMEKIIKHLGFKDKKITPLERVRYTGVGEKRLKEKELNNVVNSTTEECINEPIEDDSTDTKD